MKINKRIKSHILSKTVDKDHRMICIEVECFVYTKNHKRLPVNPSAICSWSMIIVSAMERFSPIEKENVSDQTPSMPVSNTDLTRQKYSVSHSRLPLSIYYNVLSVVSMILLVKSSVEDA